jgi:5-methylcytosine-specific restriction endonuclease McrA
MGFSTTDWIPCEVCRATAVDIHHIESRGMGGSKTADTIDNLMALCRECHVELRGQETLQRAARCNTRYAYE